MRAVEAVGDEVLKAGFAFVEMKDRFFAFGSLEVLEFGEEGVDFVFVFFEFEFFFFNEGDEFFWRKGNETLDVRGDRAFD